MIQERQYIKDNLYEVFAAILVKEEIDEPVIFEDEDGLRPKAPFISIQFRTTVGLGATANFSKVKIEPGSDGIQLMSQPIRRNMTCYGFGESAMDVLETIKTQLQIDEWVDELRRRNLVIPQVMEVVEGPKVISVVTEKQASFDFDLGYIRVVETRPGFIENVELKPTYVLDEKQMSVGGL